MHAHTLDRMNECEKGARDSPADKHNLSYKSLETSGSKQLSGSKFLSGKEPWKTKYYQKVPPPTLRSPLGVSNSLPAVAFGIIKKYYYCYGCCGNSSGTLVE